MAQEIKLSNEGVSGNNSTDVLQRLEKDVINKSPDLVILMVGTNDMVNSNHMLSFNEYTENLQKIVGNLKVNKTKVVLMSPPPVDSIYLFQRHDPKKFKECPNVKLSRLSELIEKLALENNIFFLDLFSEFNERQIPNHNQDLYIRNEKNSGVGDGVHMTPMGNELIAGIIYEFLKKNQLLKPNSKIACLGDSLTYGARMVGEATTIGQTYPAYLNRKINDKNE